MKILTAEQMNRIDRMTTERYGVPSLTLMENAGFHLYQVISDYIEEPEELSGLKISIVCGKGNNGGDGFVLARQLLQREIEPTVFLLSKKSDVAGDAAVNLNILSKYKLEIIEVLDETSWTEAEEILQESHIIVDAMLGTGISKPLQGVYKRAAETINQSDALVLAVDIPSGMFSDSLEASPLSVQADVTVTFTAPKRAHILNFQQEHVGDLYVVPIGTPAQLLEESGSQLELMTLEQVQELMPPRSLDSHKGTYGKLALIAGSTGKSGAAALCSTAALRCGAGLVTACVPRPILGQVAVSRPELMTLPCSATDQGCLGEDSAQQILEFLQDKDAAGLGPGLGRHPETESVIHRLVQESPVPMVLDADALNAFQGQSSRLKNQNGMPLILTPHPGEFSRLTGIDTTRLLKEQLEISAGFCRQHQVWLILKTFRPLVVDPEGRVAVSPLGNPGMATAGVGDTLTGIVTSLLGQFAASGRGSAEDVTLAVRSAVFLHGLAGDEAAKQRGWDALIAGDIIDALPLAFQILDRP